MKKFKYTYIPEYSSDWKYVIIEAEDKDKADWIFIDDYNCANDINPEVEELLN